MLRSSIDITSREIFGAARTLKVLRRRKHKPAGLVGCGQYDTAIGRDAPCGALYALLRVRGRLRVHCRRGGAQGPYDAVRPRGVLFRRGRLGVCAALRRRAGLAPALEIGAGHAVLTVDFRHCGRIAAQVGVILPSELPISGLDLGVCIAALKIVYTIFADKAIHIGKSEVHAATLPGRRAAGVRDRVHHARAQRAEEEGVGRVLEVRVVLLAEDERREGGLEQFLHALLRALGYHVHDELAGLGARYPPEGVVERAYLRRHAAHGLAAEALDTAEHVLKRALAETDERRVVARLVREISLVNLLRVGVAARGRAEKGAAREVCYAPRRAAGDARRAQRPAAEGGGEDRGRHVGERRPQLVERARDRPALEALEYGLRRVLRGACRHGLFAEELPDAARELVNARGYPVQRPADAAHVLVALLAEPRVYGLPEPVEVFGRRLAALRGVDVVIEADFLVRHRTERLHLVPRRVIAADCAGVADVVYVVVYGPAGFIRRLAGRNLRLALRAQGRRALRVVLIEREAAVIGPLRPVGLGPETLYLALVLLYLTLELLAALRGVYPAAAGVVVDVAGAIPVELRRELFGFPREPLGLVAIVLSAAALGDEHIVVRAYAALVPASDGVELVEDALIFAVLRAHLVHTLVEFRHGVGVVEVEALPLLLELALCALELPLLLRYLRAERVELALPSLERGLRLARRVPAVGARHRIDEAAVVHALERGGNLLRDAAGARGPRGVENGRGAAALLAALLSRRDEPIRLSVPLLVVLLRYLPDGIVELIFNAQITTTAQRTGSGSLSVYLSDCGIEFFLYVCHLSRSLYAYHFAEIIRLFLCYLAGAERVGDARAKDACNIAVGAGIDVQIGVEYAHCPR